MSGLFTRTSIGLRLANIAGVALGSVCTICGQISKSSCAACEAQVLQIASTNNSPKFHDDVIVAFAYHSKIRKMILGFKYRNQRSSIGLLGGALVARIRTELVEIDLVTWAPTTRARKFARGHDHAELIARYIAGELQIPCRQILRRLSTEPQTGRTRNERLTGPRFLSRDLNNQHVLVIDDVITTGATLKGASRALYSAGAGRVSCAAVASTVSWASSIESCAQGKARRSRP